MLNYVIFYFCIVVWTQYYISSAYHQRVIRERKNKNTVNSKIYMVLHLNKCIPIF